MAKKEHHEIDCSNVDDLDEIDDDCQLALVWCNTHKRFEWHNVRRADLKEGNTLVTNTRSQWGL